MVSEIMSSFNMADSYTHTPIVSICCLTYNHVQFIERALDSFLMQETGFAYEILIHDDASTDGTAEIIRKYQQSNPLIIKPIYQTENQWSKGVHALSATYNFSRAKGKYIAMCEGDDYWTDPLKLQKQITFLESHQEYILCSGGYQSKYKDEIKDVVHDKLLRADKIPAAGFAFELGDLPSQWLTKTLTVLFRNITPVFDFSRYRYPKDVHIYYHILKQGKGYYFKEIFGVYNVHENGVYSLVDKLKKAKSDYICYQELYNIHKDDFSRNLLLRATLKLLATYANRSWIGYLRNFDLVFQIIAKIKSFRELKYLAKALVPSLLKQVP